jgi:hypothetical protein
VFSEIPSPEEFQLTPPLVEINNASSVPAKIVSPITKRDKIL